MSRKKKENAAQSTRQLMGIDGIKDYCIATRMGDLVFFMRTSSVPTGWEAEPQTAWA